MPILSRALTVLGALALAGVAHAADLPSRKAPPVMFTPVPVFSWTGFYIGAQAGYVSERFRQNEYFAGIPTGFSSGWKGTGALGGGHAGYNFEVKSIVMGLEGDVEGTSLRGTQIVPSAFGGFNAASLRQDVRGSLRGRIGYAFDRLLIYGTGGLAVANFRSTLSSPFASDRATTTRTGYMVGGGIEYAFLPNWSARAEYRYSDFARVNQTSVVAFPGFNYQTAVRDHSVRGAISYHFNMFGVGPVVARY